MADNSLEIIQPFDYHPCDTPRGCIYYDLDVLTDEQQIELNKLKIKTMRQDEKYLATHPEVRAFVSLILRYVLVRRPYQNVHQTIASFFNRPKCKIIEEVEHYIINRGKTQDAEEEVEEEEIEYESEMMEEYFENIQSVLEGEVEEEKEEQQFLEEEIEEEPEKIVKEPEITDFQFAKNLILDQIYQLPSDIIIQSDGSRSSDVISEILNVTDYQKDAKQDEDNEDENVEQEEEVEEEFDMNEEEYEGEDNPATDE